VSASGCRGQVAHARERGVSLRRACKLKSVSRSSLDYQSKLAEKDGPVIAEMRRLAGQYPRFGYRRIQVIPRRARFSLGVDRTFRLWRQAGVQVPRGRPRKRVAGCRPRPLPPVSRHDVWTYHCLFDSCANGQSRKCLTIIDEFTRECLAVDVGGSIRSRRVIEVLSQLVSVHGAPRHQRSDNGPLPSS